MPIPAIIFLILIKGSRQITETEEVGVAFVCMWITNASKQQKKDQYKEDIYKIFMYTRLKTVDSLE